MDSIIPLGQKNTLAEYMILSGADNRPPMLDKDFPLIWPTIEENGVTRTKKYVELSVAEKIQADCDMKATNIIIQGLPADIYSLVNHHRVNTKFLNSLPPEWSKFVTDVKLVKVLHSTNFDQLHEYIKQHELHANEVRLLRERNQDPLAFVSNQQMTPPHFNTYQSSYNNPQIQQQFPPSQYGSIHPNQHYSSTYTSQPQFNHSLIAYQSPQVTTQPITESPLVNSDFVVPVFSPGDDPIACLNKAMVFLTVVASSSNATSSGGNNTSRQARVVKCYNCQGEGHMARKCTQPKRPRNEAWYKDKEMLAEAQEARQILDEEQLAFLTDPGVPDGQAAQIIIPNNVLHSETNLNDVENQGVHAIQDFEQTPVVGFTDNKAQQDSMILSVIEQMSEQMINHEKLALKEQVDSLEQTLSKQIKEKECLLQTFTVFKSESKEKEDKYMENKIDLEKKIKELDNILFKVCYQNPFHLKKAQQIKPTLYDGIVIFDKHVAMPVIDDEETLILEEESRSKMSEKEKDPEAIKQNISHIPIDYEKLNRLSDDFGKCFTPQQELSAEQAFWLRMSNPTSKPSDASPIKIEAPKELPKVSLVNESLIKLKFHLARFDNVVKIRTTPNARTEGEWMFEHTKVVFNNEIIPFLKSLKNIFNVFDRDLLNEIMEVQTVFDQMDAAVQQSLVDKQYFKIAKK
ncbi:retrovirus-related pol polyprotein from transposon TNT 1-94 [Tanacetum coccineum]